MAGRLPYLAVWRDSVRDSELDQVAKLVGFTLSTYMDAKGRCWPAKETLARACGMSKRTIDRAVNRLEGAELVQVSRSLGRSSNSYQAHPTPSGVTGFSSSNPVTDDTQPCHTASPTVSRVTP